MGATDPPLYRHAGGAMLRAAILPLQSSQTWWPTLSDPGSCWKWLLAAWTLPGFADATRYASGSFAALVEAVLKEEIGSPGTDVDHLGDFSWGRSSSMGPQESMTRASAALAEWKP